MDDMALKEAGEKWGVPARRVNYLADPEPGEKACGGPKKREWR